MVHFLYALSASFCLVGLGLVSKQSTDSSFFQSSVSGTHPEMCSIPELRRKLVELRGTWKPFGIELMVYADLLSSSHVFFNLNNPCLNMFFNSNNMLMVNADPLSFSQFSRQT